MYYVLANQICCCSKKKQVKEQEQGQVKSCNCTIDMIKNINQGNGIFDPSYEAIARQPEAFTKIQFANYLSTEFVKCLFPNGIACLNDNDQILLHTILSIGSLVEGIARNPELAFDKLISSYLLNLINMFCITTPNKKIISSIVCNDVNAPFVLQSSILVSTPFSIDLQLDINCTIKPNINNTRKCLLISIEDEYVFPVKITQNNSSYTMEFIDIDPNINTLRYNLLNSKIDNNYQLEIKAGTYLICF